ncbi:MAG: helix-turn-helix domain-containing protein [Myxococcota bacterium]|jgi:curved DNA-binding protein CbpA|nr:hypothetical protein [Deltaproteobacteria bacterium]MCP4245057.1 DnaJ domain-containing protein [bacterium]MDP6074076.1 helix-turn-helix domain-containing protein [Myxococcota bacterium]MDP6242383.1 helix-turn-helix domain-containing protein [Myxococcota bacterium]MDP7075162.1 helix-turn-helix domain-containing protein [Myxococcota bacterium]
MKPLADLDHYEVLEISRSCSLEDVARAYQLSMATYADESMAGHSVFEPGDAAAMRERIETAYRVLSDTDSRRAYDAGLDAVKPLEPEPEEIPESNPTAAPAEIEPVEAFDEESDQYDGARLRRSRLRRGLEIDDVASVTKVNPTYLRFLEEERFPDLPARVYVRGFLMAYASAVGLDPPGVAASYLERFDGALPERKGIGRRG